MDTHKYITVNNAAERLGVTRHAIYKWIKQGRLTAHRFGELRGIRIAVSELDRFEQDARIEPRNEEPGKRVGSLPVPV
jgi:excisionase family DNA binding protein